MRQKPVYFACHAPVAQLDRVLVSETKGHRFASCRARQITDFPGLARRLRQLKSGGRHNQEHRMSAISRYPVPKLEDLPQDIRERIVAVQHKAGFVPNVYLTLAHRPDEFRAFFAYHDELMENDSGVTKDERERMVVA